MCFSSKFGTKNNKNNFVHIYPKINKEDKMQFQSNSNSKKFSSHTFQKANRQRPITLQGVPSNHKEFN